MQKQGEVMLPEHKAFIKIMVFKIIFIIALFATILTMAKINHI